MDPSQVLLTRLFRQLFRHRAPTCQRRPHPSVTASTTRTATAIGQLSRQHRDSATRTLSLHHPSRRRLHTSSAALLDPGAGWIPRDKLQPRDLTKEIAHFPLVTADQLAKRRERPKGVKMLVRDFIDDSLYNPYYGYFSKEAVIFNTEQPFHFTRLKDENAFTRILAERYTEFEDKLDETQPNKLRQLWHTPTELFRPYYGEAIARYLHENYIDMYPVYDLIVYEIGAGNGTLMVNVLDYLRDHLPHVYIRTQYKIIEISNRLSESQRQAAERAGHGDHVEIVNTSMFDFNTYVANPCFFLALEVFDNFAHDMIRYDLQTQQPLQGYVLIDRDGEFHEYFTPTLDPQTKRYLYLRDKIDNPEHERTFNAVIAKSFAENIRHGGWLNRVKQDIKSRVWFSENLSAPEFIPTKAMQFLELLNSSFPHHRLLMSDFDYLPDTIEGIMAPVVQTRYKRETIAVKHLFVQQGYFDILFPTDFVELSKMYQLLSGKFAHVESHEKFMRSWAELKDTTTKSKENPLLNWYKNASVMTTS